MVTLEAIHYAEEQSRHGHALAFIILLAKEKLRWLKKKSSSIHELVTMGTGQYFEFGSKVFPRGENNSKSDIFRNYVLWMETIFCG